MQRLGFDVDASCLHSFESWGGAAAVARESMLDIPRSIMHEDPVAPNRDGFVRLTVEDAADTVATHAPNSNLPIAQHSAADFSVLEWMHPHRMPCPAASVVVPWLSIASKCTDSPIVCDFRILRKTMRGEVFQHICHILTGATRPDVLLQNI